MDEQLRSLYRFVLIYGYSVRVTQAANNEYIITGFKQDQMILSNILDKAGPEVAAAAIKNLKAGEFILSPNWIGP